uniref:Small ribosomal subunit protein uS11m n=1 Tax=Pogona vitticeps TaxID=103695 RepID=A0A6J0SUH5_9SAUR
MIPRMAMLARRGLLGGDSGGCLVAASRRLQTGIQRLGPDLTEVPTDEPDVETSPDFSYLPPAPGKESSLRWDGMKYEEIPICYIKATYNNTHIQVRTPDNAGVCLATCGTEGFKNAKKATPVASQVTGIAAAAKAIAKGVGHVRVIVKGVGPGRMAAIEGLTLGGLKVVSITDNTPIPHNGCRPRKARRV